jgi:hypothetical protein
MTSVNILVLAADKKTVIGAIERLSIKETKSLHDDGYTSTGVKLEITRMRLARSKLDITFQNGNFHVASQVYPVHIVVTEDKVETIRATNVWISGIDSNFTTDEWIIAEVVEAECEFIAGTQTYKSSSDE